MMMTYSPLCVKSKEGKVSALVQSNLVKLDSIFTGNRNKKYDLPGGGFTLDGRADILLVADGERGDGDVGAVRPLPGQLARPHGVLRPHVHHCVRDKLCVQRV